MQRLADSQTTIRLVVALRHQLCSDAFSALLQAHSGFHVVCTTNSTKVATEVGQLRNPDAVLLDAAFVDRADGSRLSKLCSQFGESRILVLDDAVNVGRLAAVLEVPEVGYFTRNAPFSDLAAAIRRMVAGERVFDPSVRSRIRQTARGWEFQRELGGPQLSTLTRRELDVLKLIAMGHSVKRCAEILDLAPSTIDNHKSRMMKKLGVHKSLDLTRLALREGLVSV